MTREHEVIISPGDVLIVKTRQVTLSEGNGGSRVERPADPKQEALSDLRMWVRGHAQAVEHLQGRRVEDKEDLTMDGGEELAAILGRARSLGLSQRAMQREIRTVFRQALRSQVAPDLADDLTRTLVQYIGELLPVPARRQGGRPPKR